MQDKAPLLTKVSGGTSIVFKNKELYGRRFPRERAETRAQAFNLEPDTLYILASPLLWYGVSILLHKLPPSSHLVAVELEPQLSELSTQTLTPEISENSCFDCAFMHGPSASGVSSESLDSVKKIVRDTISKIGVNNFRRARLITLNGGYRLNNQRYSALLQLIEEEIQQFWHNKYTMMHMLPLWIKNIFFNLASLHELGNKAGNNTSDETGSYQTPQFNLSKTNKPVMVIGAGPSLEYHIAFIREHRQHLYLTAVDTAYTALRSHNIQPDLVVVQESQFYNLYDFISYPFIDCAVLADISSYPQVLHLAQGPVYLFATKFAETAMFDRLQARKLLPYVFPPLGSVGTTAVHAALAITRSEIIVTGIDFAFPPGLTHSRGTPSHQLRMLHSNRFTSVEDMETRTTKGVSPAAQSFDPAQSCDHGGKLLLTSPALRRYAENFARIFHYSERLFLLQPRGLPLGITEITHDQLSLRLISEPQSKSGDGPFQPFHHHLNTPSPNHASNPNDSPNPAPGHALASGTESNASPKSAHVPGNAAPLEDTFQNPQALQSAVGDFLRAEKALLESIYTRGTEFLQGIIGPQSVEADHLIKDINRCEYLFLHFPETGYKLSGLDPTLLKRILVSTGHYIKTLEEALELSLNST